MANHPYGLRGDPFESPATLSPKDASRLIRRRVRIFNGDGGVLFPIDTCDLIHQLAGGIPDAMLGLAGEAMRIAAAEGAPAVAPDHVRKAAETARSAAEAASVPASMAPMAPMAEVSAERSKERAVRAIDALLEAAQEAAGEGAPIAPGTPAPQEPGRSKPVAADVAPVDDDEAVAAAFEAIDDDLPPFQPASFALPSQPSENLDADAREWVSRFIQSSGPGPAADEPEHVAPTPTPRGRKPSRKAPSPARPARSQAPTPTSPSPAAEAEPEPILAYAASSQRRPSRRNGSRRHRRNNSQSLLFALAAVCIVVFVVRMSWRATVVSPGTAPERPVPTSAPIPEPPTPSSPPAPAPRDQVVEEAMPADPGLRMTPALQEPVRVIRPPDPNPPALAPASGTPSVVVEPRRRAAPTGKFGLEVATFIFEERARVERDRLSGAGLRARVVTTVEYGSRVYRVVVGGYPHPAAAERAADSLLSNGVVLQARVVTASFGR